MNPRIIAFIAALLLASIAFAAEIAHTVPLKDGDRVVIYGDSITEQRLYSRYLQQYVYCRYPDLDVRFFNAGWGGDRAPRALERLDRDVLVLKPTVVTLFFGMNDGDYRPLNDDTLSTYRQGMDDLVKKLRDNNVRVIVFSPGCVDYDRRENLRGPDYNKTLQALGGAAKEIADKYECAFIDIHTPMLAYQTARKQADAKFTMIPDGVHPDAKGHLVMASIMAPALAGPMEQVTVKDGIALVPDHEPFWVEDNSRETFRLSGFEAYASRTVVAPGLAPAMYQLNDTGHTAVRGTAADFAKGVPYLPERGKRLHDLIAQKEDAYFFAWRQVKLPMGDASGSTSVNADLMAVDDAYDKAIHNWTSAERPDEKLTVVPLPDDANLALGRPVESSDPNRYGWAGSGLTDGVWGDKGGICYASGDADAFPKTATIDLGTSLPVAKVIVGVPAIGSTRNVGVSLSEDGKTFKDVGTYAFSFKKAERKMFEFDRTAARYVRLTFVDHYEETSGPYSKLFAFSSEAEVYGPVKR